MIVEKALDLEGRLRNLQASKSNEQTQNVWRHHVQELNSLLDAVTAPLSFLQWLRSRSEAVSIPDASQTVKLLCEVRDLLQSDPNSLLGGQLLMNTKTKLQESVNALEDAATSGWLAYTATLPAPDAELFAPFETQGRYRELVRKARIQDQKLTDLINRRYLFSEAERTGLERLLEARLEIRSQLPSVGDDEIRRFVQSAARQGANLDDLTPKVAGWLRENDLEESYVVRRKAMPGGSP